MSAPIFVNRILNLKRIKAIGLDMDHTLIEYRTEQFEALVFELAIESLIQKKNYPNVIRALKFDMTGAIRGLVIDTEHGNILKLSRYAAIRESYHGTKSIDFKSQQAFYGSAYIDLKHPNYEVIDTSFSIAFCVLYSQLVDLKDEKTHELPSYHVMAKHVLEVVDGVHRDGSLKQKISENLDKYVIKNEKLVHDMLRFVRYDKKILLITNSEYEYMKTLLDYAINPYLPEGMGWDNLFEYVIAKARKPSFFYTDEAFLKIDVKTGAMKHLKGVLTPGVYEGGNTTKLTEALKLDGSEILYIGDHIYGDVLRLKKACNWRTALVVEELGAEIKAQHKAHDTTEEISQKMDEKIKLERKHVKLLTKRVDEQTHEYDKDIASLQAEIMAIDVKLTELLTKERMFYNPMWGQVFRAGAEESFFAYQVDRYACVYMERLADFFACSPLTYFRANRRLLPHDMI